MNRLWKAPSVWKAALDFEALWGRFTHAPISTAVPVEFWGRLHVGSGRWPRRPAGFAWVASATTWVPKESRR